VTVPLYSVLILLHTSHNIWNNTHSAGSFVRVNAEREKQRLAGDVLAAVQLIPSTRWIYSTVGVAETQLWTVVRHWCFWQCHLQKDATPCTGRWRQPCNQGYKICPTFCSREWYCQYKEPALLSTRNPHQVTQHFEQRLLWKRCVIRQ